MTTSIPSGLGTSVGFSAESVVGTATTSGMRWLQHDKVTAEYKKTTVTSQGLHQGLYMQGKRRNFLTKEATLQMTMDAVANKMGLLFKHALGSSPSATQMASTSVYSQNHQPGDTLGLGLTIQVNKAETSGTLQQFTYSGCKVTDWQLSVAKGGLAKWDMTMDAWLEDTSTSLAAVSYVATDVFDFHQGSLLTGGTVTYPGSVVTVTSGTAPTALVTGFTIKGVNGLDTQRFNLGTQTKAEQLSNTFRQITGTIDLEFANTSDVYSAFVADSILPLHFALTGPIPASGSPNHELIDVILPDARIDSAVVDVGGPGTLTQKVTFSAYDDTGETSSAPIQVIYQSTDTAV